MLALTGCSSGTSSPTASSGRAPGAPTALALAADGSTQTVSWAKPDDPGSSGITGHRLSVNGLSTASPKADTTTFEVDDVQPGEALTISIAASKDAGDGPPATSKLVMPTPSPTPTSTPSPTPTGTSPTPAATTRSSTPTSAVPAPTSTRPGSASGPGKQPTTNPNAFVPPPVVSTRSLGCTALPTIPVTHHWQVEVVTRGGQNWMSVNATVHGTGLIVEADTNRSGLLMTSMTSQTPPVARTGCSSPRARPSACSSPPSAPSR